MLTSTQRRRLAKRGQRCDDVAHLLDDHPVDPSQNRAAYLNDLRERGASYAQLKSASRLYDEFKAARRG